MGLRHRFTNKVKSVCKDLESTRNTVMELDNLIPGYLERTGEEMLPELQATVLHGVMDTTTEDCASLVHVRTDIYQDFKEFIEQRYTDMQAGKVDIAEKPKKTLNAIEAGAEDG